MIIASYSTPHKLRSYQITLTLANTNYGVANLVAAIDANCPATSREIVIQSDDTNGSAKIMVGDANITGTRFGFKLNSGDSRTYVVRGESVDIQDFWVRSDTAGVKVNVEMADF